MPEGSHLHDGTKLPEDPHAYEIYSRYLITLIVAFGIDRQYLADVFSLGNLTELHPRTQVARQTPRAVLLNCIVSGRANSSLVLLQ